MKMTQHLLKNWKKSNFYKLIPSVYPIYLHKSAKDKRKDSTVKQVGKIEVFFNAKFSTELSKKVVGIGK